MRSHDWIDRRSLALHELVAAKLEADPSLIDEARGNLARWSAGPPTGALAEWRQILEVTPLTQLVALLRSTSEAAVRLRQSSPFAGFLTQAERRAILQRYESRRPCAHSASGLSHR